MNKACGWFDQKGGDWHIIHNYICNLHLKPQKDRTVALAEYGGYAWQVKGRTACETEFGHHHYGSEKELTDNYERLWEEDINGVVTCDREIGKLGAGRV